MDITPSLGVIAGILGAIAVMLYEIRSSLKSINANLKAVKPQNGPDATASTLASIEAHLAVLSMDVSKRREIEAKADLLQTVSDILVKEQIATKTETGGAD